MVHSAARAFVTLGMLLALVGLSAHVATADPVGNRSQDCKRVDDNGYLTHGRCVTAQTPSAVCRNIESLRLESGLASAYPYNMQIYVADATNVAVPATPVLTINHYGACVGALAPWSIEWVAISLSN
jgi:hypothetical protein